MAKLTDKEIEKSRYDERANQNSSRNKNLTIKNYLAEPYDYYHEKVADLVGPNSRVLELGCGTGEHSQTASSVSMGYIGVDISSNSLCVLKNSIQNSLNKINLVCGDIEKLPFSDSAFDIVLSAGSLSYGNNNLVMTEIHRVLKDGGYFICVDSLNNNIVYKVNRFMHYLLGNRSLSTLKRMPNLKLLRQYSSTFRFESLKFFGSISYLMPLISVIFGDNIAYRLSKRIDKLIGVRSSAFKFVMILRK